MNDQANPAATLIAGCVVWITYAVIGALAVDYLSPYAIGRDLPFWADFVIGLVGYKLFIPAAIIVFVLQHAV